MHLRKRLVAWVDKDIAKTAFRPNSLSLMAGILPGLILAIPMSVVPVPLRYFALAIVVAPSLTWLIWWFWKCISYIRSSDDPVGGR